jgi:chorismate synthase
MSNSLGEIFRITSFGESHGQCIGVIIDGCPAGLYLTEDDIQVELDKRKPAARSGQTSRAEEDRVEILSGLFRGYTTGAPIGLIIRNKDTDSRVYERIKNLPRPGHADFTAYIKYGGFNDYRGGGRFSGRVTAGMVMAGAIARKLLNTMGVLVAAYTSQIGNVKAKDMGIEEVTGKVYNNPLRCPDVEAAKGMMGLIEQAEKEGDSLGGVIQGLALNLPVGLGEPYFETLEGEMAKALFSIPAIKGVEFGAGFRAVELRGSENNDPFIMKGTEIKTSTNKSGGVLGGISNGMPLTVRVAVKPTPSIRISQKTVDLESRQNAEFSITGRHDVCIVPRAVIVVESMMAVTLCDFGLQAGMIKRVM